MDNAPYDVILDPETHTAYQQTYFDALGKDKIAELIEGRLMTARPTEPVVRAHEMGIYKRYFDLIATGRKTTEIRVNDSSRQKIKAGSLIRFRCQGDDVLTRVTRIARYANFDEMFAHEELASVNPLATREEQLANLRQIYPPEREALGVVALGIKLVDPPRTT